jgi:hypothetical protein
MCLGQFAANTQTGIDAWALMTNHAHVLNNCCAISI